MSFAMYFKREVVAQRRRGKPFLNGLSLGSGHGQFELELVRLGVASQLLGVDLSDVRVAEANNAVPKQYKDKLKFEVRDLESWNPTGEKFDLIVLKMAFHHIERIEFFIDLFDDILLDDGYIYFDEYIGPKRFQFAQSDIDACNDILRTLPPEMTKDKNNRTHVVGRPNLEKFIRVDPSEVSLLKLNLYKFKSMHIFCLPFLLM